MTANEKLKQATENVERLEGELAEHEREISNIEGELLDLGAMEVQAVEDLLRERNLDARKAKLGHNVAKLKRQLADARVAAEEAEREAARAALLDANDAVSADVKALAAFLEDVEAEVKARLEAHEVKITTRGNLYFRVNRQPSGEGSIFTGNPGENALARAGEGLRCYRIGAFDRQAAEERLKEARERQEALRAVAMQGVA